MTKTMWFDFSNNKVYEATMNFPRFSEMMKLDNQNDIQLLTWNRVESL